VEGWRDSPEGERFRFIGQDILRDLPADGSGIRGGIKPGDVLRPAMVFVNTLVNGHLGRNAGPQLIYDPAAKRSVVQECPYNLLGVIALQFAEEIHSRRRPRRCPVCGQWFDLGQVPQRSQRLTRSERETCSSGCRTRAYRQRQAIARQLFAEGKSVREIARSLDCKPEAVKGWVKGIKRGG